MTEYAHKVATDDAHPCPQCYGWGLTRNLRLISVQNVDACVASDDWMQCLVCGGTPIGRYRDNPRYPEGAGD